MAAIERETSSLVQQAFGERILREMDPPILHYVTQIVNIDTETFASDLEYLVTTLGPMLEAFVNTEQQMRTTCARLQQLLQVTYNLGGEKQKQKDDEPQRLKHSFKIGDTDTGDSRLDQVKSVRGEWRPESIQFKMSEKERQQLEERSAQKSKRRAAKEDTEKAAEQAAKEEALKNVQSTVQLPSAMLSGSMPLGSKDIRLEGFSIHYGRVEILSNATLVLNQGVRYGLVGKNGIGKSTLLRHIANGDLPLPADLKIVYVAQEVCCCCCGCVFSTSDKF
jgi:ATP-binding cassette subfamily F protein 3